MANPIYHITPFTLLDYPDKLACIIWFAGCNMRCEYCYNIDIVKGKGRMSYNEVLDFLDTRKNLLDAVVLSGGECMLHTNIEQFIRNIKQKNMLIKIDTNGSNPRALSRLLRENLVDYVALDFKALRDRFYKITGSDHFNEFDKTLNLLMHANIPFEVRTTIHSKLLDEKYLLQMAAYLKNKGYAGKYYLQKFFNDTQTLGEMENDYESLPVELLQECGLDVCVRTT